MTSNIKKYWPSQKRLMPRSLFGTWILTLKVGIKKVHKSSESFSVYKSELSSFVVFFLNIYLCNHEDHANKF